MTRATRRGRQTRSVDREIASVVMLDVHSSEADVLYETKVREQLAFLANEIDRATNVLPWPNMQRLRT